MISLPDREAILAALETPLPAGIRPILQRIADDHELSEYTHVAIIEAGDTEQAIINEIGRSPFVHPIDEVRCGDPGFEPYWAYLGKHGGWFELSHPVGNSGFAYVLLIEDAGDGGLQAMCREYTS